MYFSFLLASFDKMISHISSSRPPSLAISGVGTLWEEMGLLDTSSGTVKYTGVNACAAWRSLTSCPAGSCPPVEQSGGAGTAGTHWDEDMLGNEVSIYFVRCQQISRVLMHG